jgi:O-Antigen ligase
VPPPSSGTSGEPHEAHDRQDSPRTPEIYGWLLRLPVFHTTVILSTVVVLTVDFEIGGYRASGWGWFLPLLASILVLLQGINRVTFPLRAWMPWAVVVLVNMAFSPEVGFQRTMQILTPVVVGAAASTQRLTSEQLSQFLGASRFLAALVGAVVLLGATVFDGTSWLHSGAGVMMTAALLASVFAAERALGSPSLGWWAAAAVSPILVATRTAIVAAALTLPLTFGPLPKSKRLRYFAVAAGLGLAAFFAPQVQSKMFVEGAGTLSDVAQGQFMGSGRFAIWEFLAGRIPDALLLGHGVGSSARATMEITDGVIAHPHSDWLVTVYDYGLVGMACLVGAVLATVWRVIQRAKKPFGFEARALLLAGGSAFVPFALLMVTDNIMTYASYFGNLQFLFLGCALAATEAN